MGRILTFILKLSVWVGGEGFGFIVLKKGTIAGSCDYGNGLLVLIKSDIS
jgi:hypothetical protein